MLDVDNPFATPSDLPYGLPPLDRIRAAHVLPAFRAGIAAQREEWEAVATDPSPPTLANTLEALERSGQLLHRVRAVHRLQVGCLADAEVRANDEVIAPALAAHADTLHLDRRIFARIDALHRELKAGGAPSTGWGEEQVRLLTETHRGFLRAGAALDEDASARLREINQRLASVTTAFGAALLAGANAAAVHLELEAQLAGLPADAMASAALAAADRGLAGWLLPMALPTIQPALAWLEDRDVRRRVHLASVSRGLTGPHDTRPLITEAAALRAERAAIFGYPSHASYAIADQTAGTVEAVDALLAQLTDPSVAKASAERAALEELLHADGHEGPLQAWDWPYYARVARADREDPDDEALAAWFPLDQVLVEGVLHAASVLYGLAFRSRPDLPRHHPEVRTYEVLDTDGRGIGLFLLDPYARPSKRGGAWMSTLVDQSDLLDRRPVVTLTMNVAAPAPGGPALLRTDEVRTLFHEFGHALHGLCSAVTYPRFSGTSVPRDVVELPSQVNEMWAWHPDVLSRYARHHATGEPLPDHVVERLAAAGGHGQARATTEYLAAALLDLAWHRLPAGAALEPDEVEAFEDAALRASGVAVDALPPRYRSTYFAHAFDGDYDARYYAYVWAEVMDADLVEWFIERGGLDPDAGRAFRERLLSRGGAVDPMAAYEAVRGRPPRVEPLLLRRGLASRDPLIADGG